MWKSLTVLALVISGFYSEAQDAACLTTSEIGISFPPVADSEQRDFSKLHLDSLGIQKIRFAEDWTFREPTQGDFDWLSLDQRLSWAQANNYEVLLTIQSRGPAWACSLENDNSCVFSDVTLFKNYVDELLQRYPNQIDKLQFGNEWQTTFWYVGNAQQFIAAHNVVYESVQTYSPETEVVLGGFTTSSLRYLAACNGYIDHFVEDDGTVITSELIEENCDTPELLAARARIDSVLNYAQYDIIDLHLYDDVEIWDELVTNFTDTIKTPLIVSEFGGPNMNVEPYTEAYQAVRTHQYIKTLDSLGIPEIYYFKLVEGTGNLAHTTSGLIEDTTLRVKPVYSTVRSFIQCAPLATKQPTAVNLSVYPNPTSNQVTISLGEDRATSSEVFIYHLNGSLAYHTNFSGSNQIVINTKKLDPGCYHVLVRSGERWQASSKLIIH